MKSVLLSVQPKWCELIASGKKTVEVRKTKPKLPTPFKCYIYESSGNHRVGNENFNVYLKGKGRKKVIGEFVCNCIEEYESEFVDDDCFEWIASIDRDEHGDITGFYEWTNELDIPYINTNFFRKCCVGYEDLKKYIGIGIDTFYGWHISDLVIYDKPKKINEFVSASKLNTNCFGQHLKRLDRPPQSWCYVEVLK
ncbi:MAG: ASCH domain-containing protein [Clostridia bacterium]|nr:ASCH domain-containing protein [Clostridia bacterium]